MGKIKVLYYSLFLGIIIFSCKTNYGPNPKHFKYYGEFTPNDPNRAYPRFDGFYIWIDSSVQTFLYNDTPEYKKSVARFFNDGSLVIYPTQMSIGKLSDTTIKKDYPGNIKGYYYTEKDSIYFSTKVFYDMDEKYYWGKISADYIDLKVNLYNREKGIYITSETKRYFFYKNPF